MGYSVHIIKVYFYIDKEFLLLVNSLQLLKLFYDCYEIMIHMKENLIRKIFSLFE